jgi:Kef-type K+ transport system membrane component KefB
MERFFLPGITACVACLLLARDAPGAETAGGATIGLDPQALVGVAVILIVAKLFGELFERIKQPAVLGEIIAGIILGNLALTGFTAAESLKTNVIISALAEIGVIILLFEVGLETNLREMLAVGWSSLFVAVSGVVVLFFLGWGVAAYFMPDAARLVHIFVGATLSATSVGITARVLKDLGRLRTREARIILGAAVIDDVLGLLLLAVVAGVIKTAGTGGRLSVIDIAAIAGKAVAFLLGAVLIGHYVVPHIFRGAGRLVVRGVLLTLSISFCFLLAWLAGRVGLAAIVGAFAAGLVLDEVHFKPFAGKGKPDLQQLIAPVSTIFVPIFFVVVGLRVDLRVFGQVKLLGFALALTVATIIGKQLCSFAAVERKVKRLVIGCGMIPRGEVSLILAGIGTTLFLPDAQGQSEPVISTGTFGVIVIMVIMTTLITPPALKWTMKSKDEG